MQYKYPPGKQGKKSILQFFVHYRGHNEQAGSQENKA